MRSRLALVIIASLVTATAAPSLAAAKPKPKPLAAARSFTFTDPAGDANGINNENGLVPGAPDSGPSTAPASIAAADILGVTLARLDDKKAVKGITVTMTLSAAPSQGFLYRLFSAAGDCSTFWFQLAWPAGGSPVSTLRHNCGATGGTVLPPTVNVTIPVVLGPKSVTWTLPTSAFPTGIKVGTVLSGLRGETRSIIGLATQSLITAPTLDETALQTDIYKIGQ